jgi:hypothetical protein
MSSISGQKSASKYGFTDPYGVTSQLQNALYGTGGAVSGGALGTYNANADSIMNQIAGLSGPLQQTLSGIANYQANNALNATASNFANQGALGSGAGAQAFGQAIAQPFAQAQAQLQQGQLSAASSALQSLMGISGQAYDTGLNTASNLMEHASGLVAPTYYTSGGKGQAGQTATGLGTSALSSIAQPTLSSLGSSLSSSLGKGATGAGAGALGASAAGKGSGGLASALAAAPLIAL